MPINADFKSGWIQIQTNNDHVVEIDHNLGVAPQYLFIVCSQTGPKSDGSDPDDIYIGDFRWYDTWAQNPVSIRTDQSKFELSINKDHPAFAAFTDHGHDVDWVHSGTGYIQVMAFIINAPSPGP